MPRHSSKKKKTRDRSRHRSKSRKRRHDSSSGSRESHSTQALDVILGRLSAIEDRLSVQSSTPISVPPRTPRECHTPPLPTSEPSVNSHSTAAEVPAEHVNQEPVLNDVTDKLVGALSSLIQVRSNHYYVSNFDPNVHNFSVWCAEVDRGRVANRWDDRECLSRIGSCLKGDARTWLSDWVTNDRTWTNFKSEFKSLCPQNIDVANILYDVMCTDSKKFVTYAEYARKSLLRLNIVSGLSDDLKTAIVIRGITDPQVKAAASNAKLQPNQLVEFLTVYNKPKIDSRTTHNLARSSNNENSFYSRKRDAPKSDTRIKCYDCGGLGHKRDTCPKKQKTESNKSDTTTTAINKPSVACTYCKKLGHSIDRCFVKQRTLWSHERSNRVPEDNFQDP